LNEFATRVFEKICESYSRLFWVQLFKTTNSSKCQKTNEDQQRKRISKHLYFNRLYALVLEKLPSGMVGSILGQKQDKKHHPWHHCRSLFVDMARIFWLVQGKQWC
jgi:hypothetical protein